MKSFSISENQLVKIACALTGDELARNFNHYTDFVTRSEWNAETTFCEEGIGLTHEQQVACAARVCTFFDKPPSLIDVQSSKAFGDWASQIGPEIVKELSIFRFLPATQAGDAESRHAADEIWQDARVVASLMHGRRRVVSLVAPHSLFGFTTSVLASGLQNLPVIDGGSMPPDQLQQELSFGDLIIATPTLWRYLSEMLPSIENNIMGISFGEALGVKLASDLREMGLGAMRELYGSTETGIIGWRDTPSESFVLFDHWSQNDGRLIRHCPKGEAREVIAMDHLDWQEERAFDLKGRRDGAVQIGAVNVFPNVIADIIAGHPEIVSCRVRVTKRSGMLDRLVAHIVLQKNAIADQDMAWKVDEWCRQKLRPQERPRIYKFDLDGEESAIG